MSVAAAILLTALLSAQQPKQVIVTSVVPDVAGQTLTITGENFGFLPFVTLNLIPLTINAVGGNRVVAAAPIALMPAATYLLTLSYGPSPEENASTPVVLGDGRATATEKSAPSGNAPSTIASLPSSDRPAARVGDRVITIGEVDREWQRSDPASYLAASRDLYDKRRRVLDTLVSDELLAREAASRRITVDALLAEEIPKRRIAMPDSAVVALYQSLGDRTRGISLDQMRPALRAWLERFTEREIAKMNYLEELMKVSTRAEVLLEAPRLDVEHAAQDATLGPEGALVEIVAFGDFQSASYVRFAQAFGKVRDTFGDRLRIRFKNLPTLGPDSAAAAEAAQCAKAQGKFWPYHDALLQQAGPLNASRLRQAATDAGLDRETFGSCVERGDFGAVTRQAANEASRYGISSSPSFFVNGRLAPDPPPFLSPFDYFKRLIEEELSKLSRQP
jgi:protein-disulfide isomerase